MEPDAAGGADLDESGTVTKMRSWIVGAVFVLCAALVTAVTPSEDAIYEAFLIRGDAVDGATTRTLNANVLGASLAERVVSADGEWDAEGNWLVVELAASAPQTEVDAEIVLATLHVDGLVFRASERVPESLLETQLHVGTDTVGVLAFELADGIRSQAAELRLTTQYTTPALDDVVVLPLPLATATIEPVVTVKESEVGR